MIYICLFRDEENAKRGRFSGKETKSPVQLEMEEEMRKRIEELEEKNCTLLKSNEEQKEMQQRITDLEEKNCTLLKSNEKQKEVI